MGEFQSTNIKSRHYNYTVDYFELRAQPGRDGNELPGTELWLRDDINDILYPVFLGDAVVLGGTTLVADEILRLIGDLNLSGTLIMGSTQIYNDSGEITFVDSSVGTVTLTDLLQGYWYRNAGSGELYATNLTDNILVGLNSGTALRRLQIKSERADNTSYILTGQDSGDVDTFLVTDQGDVYLRGLYFDPDTYIIYDTGAIDFHLDGSEVGSWAPTYLASTASWKLSSSGSLYYTTVNNPDGIGFPSAGNVAIYINNSPDYNFSASGISFPQDRWISSGVNMIKVNALGQIEINNFVLDPSEHKIYLNANTYIYENGGGNLTFYDVRYGSEVTLSTLMSAVNVYWERDHLTGVIYPAYSGDKVQIDSLAGVGTRAVVAEADGTLSSTLIINYWRRSDFGTWSLIELVDITDYLVIGNDSYSSEPTDKFEVWEDNSTFLGSIGSAGISVGDKTTVVRKNANDDLELEDANLVVDPDPGVLSQTNKVTLQQLAGYTHVQGTGATVWNIPHNLGRRPIVQVRDTNGKEWKGEVAHTDLNNLTITFGFAHTGVVECR